MKIRIFLFSVMVLSILFIFHSCKKKKSDEPTPTTPSYGTPTAVGTNTGTPNSITIDATGGTITSADGRLEIIIPANALTIATAINIQPVTNTSPGGAGVSYDLSPNGQQFDQPITIRFHYDAADLEATSFYVLGVAYQKSDNIWYSFDNTVLDSVAGTVSINTSHFSIYSLYKKLYITPPAENIKVNETVNFKVVTIKRANKSNATDDLTPLDFHIDYPTPSNVSWTLNGSLVGIQNDGTIAPTSNSISTTYTAPSSTSNMSANPAIVTAEVSGVFGGGASKVYLSAKVKVSGKIYLVDVTVTGTNVGYADVYINYSDFGSFMVTIDNSGVADINAIINNTCQMGAVTPGACSGVNTGQGNFLDMNSVDGQVISDQLYLVIHNNWTAPGFTENCPGTGTVNIPAGSILKDYLMPGFPINNSPQTVTLPFASGVIGETVTITATPQ